MVRTASPSPPRPPSVAWAAAAAFRRAASGEPTQSP